MDATAEKISSEGYEEEWRSDGVELYSPFLKESEKRESKMRIF